MFNNDVEYARSRIISSYVKGSPEKKGLHYIVDIRSKNNQLNEARILAYNETGEQQELNINDLSFSVGRLGYVNDRASGLATFLSRVPIRRDYRQGLRYSQLCYLRNGSSNAISEHWMKTNVKSINKCLEQDYPSFETVTELVEEYNVDVAFNRNFAISNKYKLLYKGFVVGDLTKDDKLKLNNQFNFVEEELAKVVGNDKLSR
jgi:hypothetical protein